MGGFDRLYYNKALVCISREKKSELGVSYCILLLCAEQVEFDRDLEPNCCKLC